MTIQDVKNLTAPEGWVDLVAIIREVKETKVRTKSNLSKTPGEQYNITKMVVQDVTGTLGIWAYSGQFFPQMQVKVHGQVKDWQGKRYMDFCQLTVMQQAPPLPQQAPQRAPQSTNDQVEDYITQKTIERTSIERQCAGRSACIVWQGCGEQAAPNEIIELAKALQYFHETGKNYYDIPEPDPSIQETSYTPPATNSEDIPF